MSAPMRREKIPSKNWKPANPWITVRSFIEGIRSAKARKAEERLKQQQADRNSHLVVAAAVGDLETVKRLLSEGADIDTSHDNKTALTNAIDGGHKETATFLLEQGADKNYKQRNSALVYAAEHGLDKVVKLAIELGANPNARGYWGDPVLALAMSAPDFDYIGVLGTMNLLIEKGADVNARDRDQETALHDAVRSTHSNRVKFVELLIENGADINAKDRHERTPLMVAADSGCSIKIIKILIAKGADINAEDDDGDTALFLAVNRGRKDVEDLLRQHEVHY